MDWERPYRVAEGLTLHVADDGELVIAAREPRKVPLDVVSVLVAFARPATAQAAYTELATQFELEREGFEAVVEELLGAGALVTGEATPAAPPRASLERYAPLLRDTRRLQSYQLAIERAAPGKRVLVAGGAAGVLAAFAARAGARSVHAVDPAPEVWAEVLAASGLAGRVELVRGDLAGARLAERAEVLVHDLIGGDPIADNVPALVEDARARLLVPDATLIPFELVLTFVAVELPRADELVDQAVALDQVGPLVGLDLGPFTTQLRRARARQPFSRPGGPLALRQLLSDEVPFATLDLRRPWRAQVPEAPVDLSFAIHTRGLIGGVAMLFRARLDDRLAIGNHPALADAASWDLAWHGFPRSRGMTVLPNDRIAVKARLEPAPQPRIVTELG